MIEDKLHREERIRLEAIAQAIIASGANAGRTAAVGDIVRRAATIEQYIVSGEVPR